MMMLELALILLCTAQIIHFSRHLVIIGKDRYIERCDQRLKSHLKWSRHSADQMGSTRRGSAVKRFH